jgi:hypothetical protein
MAQETPAPTEATDEPEITSEDVAAAAQEPASEAPPESPSASPWDPDLQERFDDPAVRKRVDQFMREKVQPYVSRLEQESAPDRNASRLWEAFHADPYTTHEQITREIYGDRADEIIAVINGEEVPESQEPASSDPVDKPDTADPLAGLPDDVKEFVQEGIEAKREREYLEVLGTVEAELAEKEIPFDRELFEPHLIAQEGDLERAKASYSEWVGKAKETFGIQVPTEGIAKPPPTLGGSNSSGGSAPPQAKEYDSIGAALDDFFAEESSPPPTV